MMSAIHSPNVFIDGAIKVPGFVTLIAHLRKSSSFSGLRMVPPFVMGLADMRLLPLGGNSLSSGISLPSSVNS